MISLKPVEQYLLQMTVRRGSPLITYHNANIKRFDKAKGSSSNHQNWQGGYRDHLTHMLNLAECTMSSLAFQNVGLPSFDSVVLAIYFHDIEKMLEIKDKDKYLENTLDSQFNIKLTEEELTAIKYAHGEDKRVMNKLGAILHSVDILSSRVLFDKSVVSGHLENVVNAKLCSL